MKQITIISGKGGTGKTTLASSFIKLAHDHIAEDCDVDAANLHIMLSPDIQKADDFIGGEVAIVSDECTQCGKCEELCRFSAISDSEKEIKIDSLRCEGCGVCEEVCPVKGKAIKLVPRYEFSVYDKKQLIYNKEKLAEIGKEYQ